MEEIAEEEILSRVETAKEEYNKLVSFLMEKVFPFREEFERRKGNDKYKGELCLNALDLLLQYSFVEVALSDGVMEFSEISIIEEICPHNNLIEFISRGIGEKFTWGSFQSLTEEQTANLMKQLRKPVFEIAKDFMDSFTMFDVATCEKDYLAYFEKCVVAFLTALIMGDGKVYDEEYCNCMLIHVLECIRKGKESLLKELEDFEGPDENIVKAAGLEVDSIKHHKSLKECCEAKKISLSESEHQVDYNDKLKATVYIEVEGKNASSGSGFVITESGLCFTCYHVVKDTSEIYVRLDDGTGKRIVKPAVLQYFDEDDDFAIIQILDIDWAYYFKLEDNYKEVTMGDEIAIFGFPFGRHINEDVLDLEPTLLRGYVASKNMFEGKYVYYLDARSCPGNSGGPVFSLKTNKVIGYLCGAYGPDRANLVFCRSLTEFFKTVVDK